MTDILIPDVPEDVLSVIDTNAEFRGVSRDEYVRQLLSNQRDLRTPAARESESGSEAAVPTHEEILEGFRKIADTYADARDPEIMAGAWR